MLKQAKKAGVNLNVRYRAFGNEISLIAAAIRNSQHKKNKCVDYLFENGVTLTEDDKNDIVVSLVYENLALKKGLALNGKIIVDKEEYELLNEYLTSNCEGWGSNTIVASLIDLGASAAVLKKMGFDVSEETPLCDEQISVLNKLATKTKMDCWFFVNDEREILDLEDGEKVLNTKEALRQFNEGVEAYPLDYDHYNLSEEERNIYIALLKQYGVPSN